MSLNLEEIKNRASQRLMEARIKAEMNAEIIRARSKSIKNSIVVMFHIVILVLQGYQGKEVLFYQWMKSKTSC